MLPGIGSVSRVLGLLVAGLWLLAVMRSGVIRKPTVFHLAAFAFFLWNLASILWSISPDKSVERASTYLRMAIFIWLIWDLYDSRRFIWGGCQAYVFGTWVTAGSLFFNYFNNIEAYRNANGRFAATGFNTNETGLLLALALPLAWYLAVSSPLGNRQPSGQNLPSFIEPGPSSLLAEMLHGLLTWVNFLYVPLAIFAILLTASRGSLIAASPVLLVIFLTFGKTSFLQRACLFVGVAAAITTFTTLIPEQNLARLSTTSEELAASDLNGRVTVWQDGLDVFEKNVSLGVGAGAFRSAIETGKAPHNVFIALVVDLGVIGLTLFIIVLLIVLMAVWHQPGIERFVWLAFLLIWLLGSMVGNWEYENVTWLFLCFIVKSAAIHVNQRKTVPTVPPITTVPTTTTAPTANHMLTNLGPP